MTRYYVILIWDDRCMRMHSELPALSILFFFHFGSCLGCSFPAPSCFLVCLFVCHSLKFALQCYCTFVSELRSSARDSVEWCWLDLPEMPELPGSPVQLSSAFFYLVFYLLCFLILVQILAQPEQHTHVLVVVYFRFEKYLSHPEKCGSGQQTIRASLVLWSNPLNL